MTKSSSKVIMAATLMLVVSLAMVLGLVLVLLAELYCSLLLRRRTRTNSLHHSQSLSLPVTAAAAVPISAAVSEPQCTEGQASLGSHLTALYSQGVIQAPRKLLYPSLRSQVLSPELTEMVAEAHVPEQRLVQISDAGSSHHVSEGKFISTSSGISSTGADKKAPTCTSGQEHFVYISNPIYECNTTRPSAEENTPPFETPNSSPSRLETGDGSSEDEGKGESTGCPMTPPLSPMKKLPAEASSVSLWNAASLEFSGSETNSKNDGSSSTTRSPCTSFSW